MTQHTDKTNEDLPVNSAEEAKTKPLRPRHGRPSGSNWQEKRFLVGLLVLSISMNDYLFKEDVKETINPLVRTVRYE